MNWSYIAGLFDGQGWVSLAIKQKDPYWIVTPAITLATSTEIGEPLKKFLERENVKVSVYKKQDFYCVSVHSWEGCHRVCSYIRDEVTGKKPTVELLMKAIELHRKSRSQPRRDGRVFTVEDLEELDRIRREIHKYARKGSKKLRSYIFR